MELLSLVVPQWSSSPPPSPTTCGWQQPHQQGEPFSLCFPLEGYRPRLSCPGGLTSPSGANQPLHPIVGGHCSGLLLSPTESSWGPVSLAAQDPKPRSPCLLPPQQHCALLQKTIIWIIFMGLKLGWEQMGHELGIWGWVSTPPATSQSFKKPSLAQGRDRGQQRSGRTQGRGAGTMTDQEEKADGTSAPCIKVSRFHPTHP